MNKPHFKLTTRFCKCGCGATWRALPTSPNEFAMRSHNSSELYEPWRTERAKFKSVKKWLIERFGEPEEKETDLEVLEQIDREEIKL